MAVVPTTIEGTDSLPAARKIMNDNFNEIALALNSLLGLFDPASGIINTSALINSQVVAKQFVATSQGITVQNGGITMLAGNNFTANQGNVNVLVGNISTANGQISATNGGYHMNGGLFTEGALSIQTVSYTSLSYVLSAITARNMKIFANTAASEFNLPNPSSQIDLFVFNANLAFTIVFAAGSWGNADASTQKLAMAVGASVNLKFLDGKWWIFGGTGFSIV